MCVEGGGNNGSGHYLESNLPFHAHAHTQSLHMQREMQCIKFSDLSTQTDLHIGKEELWKSS